MPVAVEVVIPDGTLEQYDGVMELMGLDGALPPGALFHFVVETDDGIKVVDVWEDAETFQRFAEEHIVPGMQQVGYEGEPDITIRPVHNHLA
jgi:hypothetical protein